MNSKQDAPGAKNLPLRSGARHKGTQTDHEVPRLSKLRSALPVNFSTLKNRNVTNVEGGITTGARWLINKIQKEQLVHQKNQLLF